MPALSRTIALPIICAASTAAAVEALPSSGELGCDDTRLETCEFFEPASGLRVRLPQDWPMRRLRVSTETGPAAAVRQRHAERWVVIDYLPEDAANPEVSLFQAVVLPRAAWQRIAAQPGPAPGIEVAASRSRVVVATHGQANPYTPDTRDAQIYEALVPSLEEISLILTLNPKP